MLEKVYGTDYRGQKLLDNPSYKAEHSRSEAQMRSLGQNTCFLKLVQNGNMAAMSRRLNSTEININNCKLLYLFRTL